MINQPWEFSHLTKKMADTFKQADAIWTPTTFCRDAYIRSGVPADKIQIVPNGIDPALFTPDGPAPGVPTSKKFTFLFVGGTIFRKGIDVLLKAYTTAFAASDDVCLVIKEIGGDSFYKGQTAEEIIKNIRKNPNAPEILYTKTMLTDAQMAELYRSCDVFIAPYRGEGFSLPTLEAMACGLPVIVTAGGATDDFVDESVGWRIPSSEFSIGTTLDGMELTGEATMLEPDAEVLVETMMKIVQHPHEVREKGLRGAHRARTEWTWKRATMKALACLDAMYSTDMSVKAQSALTDKADVMTLFTTTEELYAQANIDDAIACYHACLDHDHRHENRLARHRRPLPHEPLPCLARPIGSADEHLHALHAPEDHRRHLRPVRHHPAHRLLHETLHGHVPGRPHEDPHGNGAVAGPVKGIRRPRH